MLRYGSHRETPMPRLPRRAHLLLHVLLVEQQRLVVDQPPQHQPLVLHAALNPVLEGEHHGARGELLRLMQRARRHLALRPPYCCHELALQRLLHRDALVRIYASRGAHIPTEGEHARQQLQRRAVRVRVHLAEVGGRQVVQRQEVL